MNKFKNIKQSLGVEPEHLSWNLGTPDNIPETEVIVNPYGPSVNTLASSMKAPVKEEPGYLDIDDSIPNEKPVVPKSATAEHYKTSMSVNMDGKEVLIPTIGLNGEKLTEDQAIQQYEETGNNLGKFNSPEEATEYSNRMASSNFNKINQYLRK